MTKTVYYTYLGTNGTITSPVHLEDIYYTRKYSLRADVGKTLTKDGENFFTTVMVPEDEVDQWKEVKDPLTGQK
jgi:hypothetical protein